MDVKRDKPQVLYISIDGMTDPLGQSQVLPYLCGLAKQNYSITIISCEKEESFKKNRAVIENIMQANDILWKYTFYDKKIPFLSQRSNLTRLGKLALAEASSYQRSFIVHCRSYLSAIIGNRIKKKFGAKFIFDMRGFWADERVDGGIWKLNNPLHRGVYRYFKRKEKELIGNADHVITLSQKAREIILEWQVCKADDVSTIPCCVDLDHFRIETTEEKLQFRKETGIEKDTFVMGYLGSLGTWYMLNEMLDLFGVLLRNNPNAIFAFITTDNPNMILAAAQKRGIPQHNTFIHAAKRSEVPAYISLFNVGLFLIRPTFSKKASSPTKMAEILACGVPVITNTGIGDCDSIVKETNCGTLVEEFNTQSYSSALDQLKSVQHDPSYLRSISEKYFSLADGITKYAKIYKNLTGSDKAKQ